MPIVISLISAKGGAGKTILSASFGKVLAEIGKKVLLVDADSATNGLTLFFIDLVSEKKKFSNQTKLFGLFDEKLERIQEDGKKGSYLKRNEFSLITLSNNLSFLPATYKFDNTGNFSQEQFEDEIYTLINSEEMNQNLDYIIIDNQAGSERNTEFVIKRNISNIIIVVSEYDPISAAGIERLKGLFYQDLTYDRTWICLNKVLPEFESNYSFLEVSKYLPPIIWNADVVRSYSRREIPIDFKFGNQFTLSIIKLIRSLLKNSIDEELNIWLSKKEELIRKPLLDEHLKIKEKFLEYIRKEKSRKLKKIQLIMLWILLLTIGSVSVYYRFASEDSVIKNQLSVVNLIFLVITLFITIIFLMSQWFTELNPENYDVELKALKKRLGELEVLRFASVEEILSGKKNPNKLDG